MKMREKICGIYKITNKINGKVYIGKSINIYYRWTQHKKIAKNSSKYRDGKKPLYYAIRKYGIDNFSFQIIEICNQDVLCDREIHWISVYNCTILSGLGYNVTNGGDSGNFTQAKPAYQYDLDGNFIAEYPTIRDAAASVCNNPDASAIQNAMGKIGSQSYGYQWRYEKFDKIDSYVVHSYATKVAQYNEDGHLINVYNSAEDAAKSIGKSKSLIRLSCNDEIRSAGGFMFRYFDERPNTVVAHMKEKKMPGRDGRPIKQMSGDMVIRVFDSAKDAAEYLGVTDRSNLYKCCNHKSKTNLDYCLYKGYRWEWA